MNWIQIGENYIFCLETGCGIKKWNSCIEHIKRDSNGSSTQDIFLASNNISETNECWNKLIELLKPVEV